MDNIEAIVGKFKERLSELQIPIFTDTENLVDFVQLEEGSFGMVFKAKYIPEDKFFAIKCFDCNTLSEEMLVSYINEINSLVKAQHDQIPKFYGITFLFLKERKKFGIITDFIDGPTLTKMDKNISNRQKLCIVKELANLLQFLHSKKLIHRDIKPDNIMIESKTGKVFLVDFGVSRLNEKTIEMTQGEKGTPRYSAPESWLVNDEVESFQVTVKFDIWSLGCVLGYLFTGYEPWKNFKDRTNIIGAMSLGKSPFDFSKPALHSKISFEEEFKELTYFLVDDLLQYDIDDRKSASEIVTSIEQLEDYL